METTVTLQKLLSRSPGGSMLAGAVLGPVGALAGAIGGAIAGSRAGAAASEGPL